MLSTFAAVHAGRPLPTEGPPVGLSGDVQRRVVDDEGRLEYEVLGAGELELNCLARKRGQVERLLAVTSCPVQVRVRGQGLQHRVTGVEDLDREPVELASRRGLGRVDVQPEAERGVSERG